MKNFLKLVLANIVAAVIIVLVLIFMLLGSLANIATSETVTVKENSILEIKLNFDMPDRAMQSAFPAFDGSSTLGLNAAMEALEKAQTDPNIQGIFLNLTEASASGWATLQEFRNALKDFKTSEKFIWAYSDMYSQSAYYIASVADKIYMHNEGMLDFRGLSSQQVFFKGFLEKIGVEMQIIRHGKFKSAVEPFMTDKMSPENREQVQKYLGGIWNSVVADISESRAIPAEEINRIANEMLAWYPEEAQKLNMIDGFFGHTEMLQLLANQVNAEKIDKLELLDLKAYAKLPAQKEKKTSKDKIAIIYAQGEIGMGDGAAYAIGSENISKAVRQAANDEKVKAIVLRVNSPGGSALASDIILQDVLAAKAKKPVVASFGNVAASGGYYISCGANAIFAQPTTITGSIGVFGMIPNAQKLLNDKLALTFDEVSTNTNAEFLSARRPITTFEQEKMQAMVERTYDVFITHVSNGRNLTKMHVDSIGQGRVWSGADAVKNGLVDELGGLNAAIEKAAELANLEDYKIVNYPKEKDQFQQLMEMMGNAQTRRLKAEMGTLYPIYEFAKSLPNQPVVMMRKPYLEEIR